MTSGSEGGTEHGERGSGAGMRWLVRRTGAGGHDIPATIVDCPSSPMRVRLDDPAKAAAWLHDLAPAHVRNLDAYQPGKPIEELERELGISGAIKVASNENPLGPSPKALAAIPAALPSLHLYPDAGGFALRRALSKRYGLPLEQLALGNGSNDLLYQL